MGLGVLGGCASQAPLKPAALDISRIHRIAVLPFDGQGGDQAANALARRLLDAGLQITDQDKNVDAVITGVMTDFRPVAKRMVFLGNSRLATLGGQTVSVNNPVVSAVDVPGTPESVAFERPREQMATVYAGAGAAVRLTEAVSKKVIWADDYSYEGIDVGSALQGLANKLVRSLSRLLPAARNAPAETPPS